MIPVSQPSLTDLERALLVSAFDSGQLTYGPTCREFERRLATRLGVRHALVTSSGTTALHLALLAAGVGPGDEVLVPDLTFVATANAVAYCGGIPVLVDVDPATWVMDLGDAAKKATNRAKAVISVHLYGVSCNMKAVESFASRRGLWMIEDAAEGFGGVVDDKPLGTFGDLGIYSFYGNKVMTTGEGGAVVTNSTNLADKVYKLRGQAMDPSRRYFHSAVGYNYRMTDLQAAIGIGQLDRLESMLVDRWRVFSQYHHHLSSLQHPYQETAAPWQFTVLLPPNTDRDGVAASLLSDHGIETRPVFVPLHRLPMYSPGLTDADFPISTDIGDRGLSLPTYVGLANEHVALISNTLLSLL
jgi:perosamine synthetase